MNKPKKMCCLCGVVIKNPWPATSKLIPDGAVCGSCAFIECGVTFHIGRAIRIRFEAFKKGLTPRKWKTLMDGSTMNVRKEHAATVRKITANRRKERAAKAMFPIHQRVEDDTRHAARMGR
jgi:hypothetical protein